MCSAKIAEFNVVQLILVKESTEFTHSENCEVLVGKCTEIVKPHSPHFFNFRVRVSIPKASQHNMHRETVVWPPKRFPFPSNLTAWEPERELATICQIARLTGVQRTLGIRRWGLKNPPPWSPKRRVINHKINPFRCLAILTNIRPMIKRNMK